MNTENNKIIAEFMGIKELVTESQFLSMEHKSHNPTIIEYLRYDTDWNSLIPVIEKCRESQIFGSQRLIDNIDKRLLKLDILATYSNVVDFINWHNQQKP